MGSQPNKKESLPVTLPPNLILRPSPRADGFHEDFLRLPRKAPTTRRQKRYRGYSTLNRQESQCSPPYAGSSTTPGSLGSASVSSIARRKDARDMFDEYGIPRPENWLSEENSESGGAELQPQPPPQPLPPSSITKLSYRVCHSCRRHLPPGRGCPDCGHESCIKCTDEMSLDRSSPIDTSAHRKPLLSRQNEAVGRDTIQTQAEIASSSEGPQQRGRGSHNRSLTPKPLVPSSASVPTGKKVTIPENSESRKRVVSDSLKSNPFVQADNIQKGLVLDPQVHPHNAEARRRTELSDCLPQRHMDRSASDSTAPGDCDNLSCRGFENGSRHSVRCASRRKALQQLDSREWNANRYVHRRVWQNQHPPLKDRLQHRIDQLYHHSDDLHRSQHIMEHLAAGTRTPAPSPERQSPYMSEQEVDSGLSIGADLRLHSLGADERDEVEQPIQDHVLHQDTITQVGGYPSSLSLHSLQADEGTDTPKSFETHTLQDDHMTQRELSPLSLDQKGKATGLEGGTLSLRPTRRFNTPKQLSPRSILDQVTGFPKGKARIPDQGHVLLEGSSKTRSALSRTLKDRGIATGTIKTRRSVIEDRHHSATRPSLSREWKAHQPRPSTDEPVVASWPRLKPVGKVVSRESWHVADTNAPWSHHTLREVQVQEEHSAHRHDTPDLSSLRQQLRKVEASEPLSAGAAPTPPISQLRRSPGRLVATPPSKDTINCGNCNPSETPSSVQDGSYVGIAEKQHDDAKAYMSAEYGANHVREGDARGEWRDILQTTPSRMRLRDLENTLAQHSAEDLQSLRSVQGGQGGKASSMRKEASLATPLDVLPMSEVVGDTRDPPIHNPRPFLPPDHACEWRTRCMDLNSEVEQLKSEMSEMESNHTLEQRGEPLMRGYISVGVGDGMAQHECHEFGIEGLTIVLHMRGKDDLVINTDLANKTPPVWP